MSIPVIHKNSIDVRWLVLAGAAALLLAACVAAGQLPSARHAPGATAIAFAVVFIAAIAVWLAALQAPSPRTGWLLLAVALAARVALLPYPASDDIKRYLWEGRLVLAGESPYAAPAADAPAQWRDQTWEAMNNKDKATVYPPLAQGLFTLGVVLGDDALALKLLFLVAETVLLLLLLAETRRRALPDANLALAAVNPVLLFATAAEAHFDAVFVLALWLALRSVPRAKVSPGTAGNRAPCAAWAWLGIAIQLKIVALLLLPLIWRRCGWRGAWALAVTAGLPLVPFAGDLGNLLGGVAAFGTATHHNGFVHGLLLPLLGDGAAALSYAVLAGWTGLIVWRIRDPFRAAFLILGGLIVFSPIVHFWYLAWVLPFLAIQPQPAWLLLSGAQAVYFSAWARFAATGHWAQPDWAWWLQWLPFALLLLFSGAPLLRRLAGPRGRRQSWPPPASITAIVPALNEASRIAPCIAALRRQGGAVRQILVVDGGSTDGTAATAAAAGAQVLRAPAGRGRQLAAGVAAATGDVLWLVHADSHPAPGTAAAIVQALAAEPAAAGGAAGQVFDPPSPLLLAIEWLNAARSALFGLSFGDQGQFVRRAALPALGGCPDQPLMEDVELSLRLRRAGPVLHLGRNGAVSARRWQREQPARRIGAVLMLTGRYLVSRRRRALSEELFRAYYAPKS